MSDNYLGEIRTFAGNFAPVGWQLCDGSLLSISGYDALYTLLGTTYGGDGQTTFGVPDLRSRVAVGQGQGPGLSQHVIGQMAGTEQVTLLSTQLPPHTHALTVQAIAADTEQPAGAYVAQPPSGGLHYLGASTVTPTDVTLNAQTIGQAGGNGAHENRMPGVATTFIIATVGIYPTRP